MEWLWFAGGGFLVVSLIGIFNNNSNSASSDDEPYSSSSYTHDDTGMNDLLKFPNSSFESNSCPSINPANGLPMIGDSCIDIEGNPFGTSTSNMFEMSQIENDLFDNSSISDPLESDFNSFDNESFSSFDDPFDTTTI